MTSAREAEIVYFSCILCLEVDVTIPGFGTKRKIVLGRLPPELEHDWDGAVRYVRPFVNAVQHADPTAIAEVARALNAEATGEGDTYYDPTVVDREVWENRGLCRVPHCGQPATSLHYCDGCEGAHEKV